MTWYEDEQPELVGYVPSERPLRSRRMVYALRIFVLVAVVALVVPGVIGEIMLNVRDAAESCKRLVNYENPGDGSSALFQVFGPNGTGWQCYTAEDSFGGSQFVGSLGWIPGPPPIPAR